MGNLVKIQSLLNDAVKNICTQHGAPNVAGVIVRDNGNTVIHSVYGVKDVSKSKSAASNQIKKTDYFNIGSITKPVSGFFMACLIRKGILSWNTTIEEVFPECKSRSFRDSNGINENFLKTKICELFSHVSGITGTYFHSAVKGNSNGDTDPLRYPHDHIMMHNVNNSRKPEWQNYDAMKYLRYWYTILCLKKKKYQFGSNQDLGYKNRHVSGYGAGAVVAAAMAERTTGKAWEELLDEIKTSTLGTAMAIKYGSLPAGVKFHKYDAGSGKYILNDDINNSLLNYSSKFPVGGMHATVSGMAQYIRYNLPAIDHAAIFDINAYHKPVTDATQGGLATGSGTYGAHLWHTGATGGSMATMRIYTTQGRGIAAMSNCNGDKNVAGLLLEELEKIHRDWELI